MGKTIKVVHLPTDLGMRAYSLCRTERELGLDSWMVVRRSTVHVSDWVKPLEPQNPSNKCLYALRLLRESLKSLKADVVMANAGQSLLDFNKMDLLDIPMYDIFKKRIIVTYQGCDIRLCETCPVRTSLPSQLTCPNSEVSYKKIDQIKLKRFKIWSRYADAILGITPDLCAIEGVIYTPHVKYIDSSLITAKRNNQSNSKIRIAHMSRRHINGRRVSGVEYIKGTPFIEEQIKHILDIFPKEVDYVTIEDLPWNQCLKIISSCDIIIDQVISGWYGGISVEAALVGTLPIAYINSALLRHIPEVMRDNLPVLALEDKEDLSVVLTDLIQNRNRISQEALRCQQSALKFHEAKTVVQQIIKKYYEPSPFVSIHD